VAAIGGGEPARLLIEMATGNASDWSVAVSPESRAFLEANTEMFTPLGVIDDPDNILTSGYAPRRGRSWDTPVVVKDVTVETSGELTQRQERERLQAELDHIEQRLANLEQQLDEKLNPPLGQEPEPLDEYDQQRRNELIEQRDALQEELAQLDT
jgi:hypothetical protein